MYPRNGQKESLHNMESHFLLMTRGKSGSAPIAKQVKPKVIGISEITWLSLIVISLYFCSEPKS